MKIFNFTSDRVNLNSVFLPIFIIFISAIPAMVPSAFGMKSVTLDPIIVTAKKPVESHHTGDVNTEETPIFFYKINRDEFAGRVENLSEVIENEAGIQIRQTGGLGSFSTVSLRGSSSDQVLVFLDGVLLNDASGGGVDLSNISLSEIDSVEIYRGISPINFGNAAIGGVVNIKTVDVRSELNANIVIGYGSFRTKKISGFINHKPGKLDFLVSADYLSSDNDFRFLNNSGTPLNPNDDRYEKRNNAKFDQVNALGRVGYDLNNNVRVAASNSLFSEDQGAPSWNNSESTDTTYDTFRNVSTLKFIIDDITPFHLNSRCQFDHLMKEETYDDSEGHIGLGNQFVKYDTTRSGVNIILEGNTDANAVLSSVGWQHETYVSNDLLNDRRLNKSRRKIISAGIQNTFFLFQHQINVTPAVRYQKVSDVLKESDTSMNSATESTRNKKFFMPQIGVKYRPAKDIIVKSNLAKYHRIPSFYELFGDRGIFIGNPKLKSEKGINFDIGIDINKKTLNRFIERISCQTVFFVSRIEDLISRSYDARGVGKSDNISNADIHGVECSLSVEMTKYFGLTGKYTWQKTNNDNDIRVFDNNQLPGLFENSWFFKSELTFANTTTYLEYIYENGMYYDTANLLAAENKSEINVGMSWLWKSFMVSMEIKNISNDQYEDFNGYPLPGRSYYFTLKYNI